MLINTIKHTIPRINILVINQISVFLTIPWLAANLSLDTFGLIATAIILIQFGWMIIEWGYMGYSTEIWKKNYKINKRNQIISCLIFSQLMLALIYILILLLLIFLNFIYIPFYFFLLSIISIVFGGIFPLWFFNINNIANRLVGVTFFSRLFFLISVFWIVKSDYDAKFFLFFHGLSFAVITIYALIIMMKNYKFNFCKVSLLNIKRHIINSFLFFINSITNTQLNNIWGFVLSLNANPILIGFFSISDYFYRAGNAVSNTFAQVIRVNTKNKKINYVIKLSKSFLFIYFILLILGLFLSEFIISLFFHASYIDTLPIIRIILFVWFFQSVIKLYGYPVLGKIMTVDFVNKLGYLFLILHLFLMLLWFLFFGSLISLVLLFLLGSFLHGTFIVFFLKKRKIIIFDS